MTATLVLLTAVGNQLEKERMGEPSLRCLSKNSGKMHIKIVNIEGESGKKLQVVFLFPKKQIFLLGTVPGE